MNRFRTILHFTAAVLLIAIAAVRPANAQGLNPDNLSFFEEPLAFSLFGLTVNYNQLVDIPVIHDFERDDTDVEPRANTLVIVERQLPNAVTVGGTYFGSYDANEDDEYEDRWALYASNVWGRISGGEVNDSVREATRRWRGTGNANLEFDDVLGTLLEDELGGAYFIRVSAWTFNAGVDEDGNSDFGLAYERPNKYVDIRLTGRVTNSEFRALDSMTVFDTFAISFVGQLEYGSFAADVGVGYENFDAARADGNRTWVSGGLHYKVRRLTLSAEGHVGEIDGDSERSIALGLRYDIARGLSANLGYNHAESNARIDGIPVQRVDKSEIIGSMRYEF